MPERQMPVDRLPVEGAKWDLYALGDAMYAQDLGEKHEAMRPPPGVDSDFDEKSKMLQAEAARKAIEALTIANKKWDRVKTLEKGFKQPQASLPQKK